MRPQGVGVESIKVLHHCQLVRNGDVRPGRVWRAQLLDRMGQRVRRNVKKVVRPVEARGAERRGLHRRAARVRDSVAEKIDLQEPLTPYFWMSLLKSVSLFASLSTIDARMTMFSIDSAGRPVAGFAICARRSSEKTMPNWSSCSLMSPFTPALGSTEYVSGNR